MKKIIIGLITLIFIFTAHFGADGKTTLTKDERAKLEYKHSIIKKSYGVMKKSELKSIHAKLKDVKKEKKKIKGAGGY